MTTHEICVRVCFDYVFDRLSIDRRLVQVLLDIALRIDDGRFVIGADVIRSVGKTTEVKLFEIHMTLRFQGILAISKPIPHQSMAAVMTRPSPIRPGTAIK